MPAHRKLAFLCIFFTPLAYKIPMDVNKRPNTHTINQ
jgi:hypothetical protein